MSLLLLFKMSFIKASLSLLNTEGGFNKAFATWWTPSSGSTWPTSTGRVPSPLERWPRCRSGRCNCPGSGFRTKTTNSDCMETSLGRSTEPMHLIPIDPSGRIKRHPEMIVCCLSLSFMRHPEMIVWCLSLSFMRHPTYNDSLLLMSKLFASSCNVILLLMFKLYASSCNYVLMLETIYIILIRDYELYILV